MTPKQIYYQNIAATIIKNMEKRQMDGFYCATKEEAVAKALELIPEGSSIGWGGSMSVNECGLMAALQDGNYNVIDRMAFTNREEERRIYGEICMSDYFLMSTNAITQEGELINIDGRGNRVAFLCWGPENVLIIAGINKIVADVESGFKRVREIAAPPNTVRLGKNTPCAKTGKCGDCYSPDCICSQFIVTRRSGVPGRIKVILVGEELGY